MSGSAAAAVASDQTVALAIVIVNYKTPLLTLQCLKSLNSERARTASFSVVVVDNGSEDESVALLSEAVRSNNWQGWLTVVASRTNLGFSGGNNMGIRSAPRSKYILLLNSDTIVSAGCLETCLRVMDQESHVGVMSCCLLNENGSIQNTARRAPTPLRLTLGATGLPWRFPRVFAWADCEDGAWSRASERRDVDWIGGAFMLIRTALLHKIGGLDEGFFFYGEDVEFCHRVWQSGNRVLYDPVGKIMHLGGQSSDPARMPESTRNRHTWDARYRVQRKCYGRVAEWWVWCIDVGSLWLRATSMRLRRRAHEPRYRDLRHALGTIVSIGRVGS